jgi:hypothetical protein
MSLDIRPNPSATGSVTGGLSYKGSYNATTNSPDLTSSLKGDFYIVSVGGTLAGVTLDVGDHIVFNQDASSPITSAMFDKIDNTDAVASVNGQTGVVSLDTDDISEGSSNLYYTNARFDTQLGTKTTDNLTEGSSNLYYTNARFDTQLGTKDTDDISEGSSNLYFTNTRADGRISAANMTDLNDVNYTAGAGIDGQFLKYVNANSRWEAAAAPAGAVSSVNTQTGAVVLDTDDISEGTSNLYYTNARFDTQLGTKDTGDLSEGSNLYYTNARADARIGAANMTDLNDVNYTAGAGIDGKFLKYVNANSRWEAADAPADAVSSVNTQTGAVVLDTDDISEGTSNLYYTNARFDTQLGTKTTDNLTEGSSNLYYTNARFDTQLGTKDTGDLSEGSNLYYTNARADARIAAANLTDLNDVNYTAGSGIDGYVLEYVHANSRWEAKEATGGGGFSYTAITSASSPVTSSTGVHYGADSSGGAIVFNLPALSGLSGGEEIRVKLNTAGNNLTLTPNGSDTIEGAASYVMSIAKEAVTCVASNGTNWEII